MCLNWILKRLVKEQSKYWMPLEPKDEMKDVIVLNQLIHYFFLFMDFEEYCLEIVIYTLQDLLEHHVEKQKM